MHVERNANADVERSMLMVDALEANETDGKMSADNQEVHAK